MARRNAFWRANDPGPARGRRKRRWIAGLAAASGLVLFGAGSLVEMRTAEAPGRARILLLFGDRVRIDSRVNGRELLIKAEGAREMPDASRLARDLPGWVEAATTGYDTLLVRSTRKVDFRVTAIAERVVAIELVSLNATRASAGEDDGAGSRLDLLHAQVLAARGRMGTALKQIAGILGRDPSNVRAIGTMASFERQVGRWRRADRLYRSGLAIEPGNRDLEFGRDEIRWLQGSRTSTSEEWKNAGRDWNERMFRYGVEGLLRGSARVGASFDRNHVDMRNVRRATGEVGSFSGERYRGELFAEQNWENGQQLRGTFYGRRSGAGAGAAYARVDSGGKTGVTAEYGRPFWEFQEGAVDGGVRDRLEVRREQRLGGRAAGWASGNASRYGLDGTRAAVRTAGVSAGVIYRPLPRSHAVVLQYGVDAEYRRSITTSTTGSGERYYPLPFYSREIHQAGVIGKKQIARSLEAEGATGMMWDRLGGSGPFFSGRLRWAAGRRISAELWFDRRLNTLETQRGKVNRAGATLAWHF
jgi:hypothetical protein